MATLEEAIAKIDGETREMLQATYDAVNTKMREFFPTLFGGGRAELVLTGGLAGCRRADHRPAARQEEQHHSPAVRR